MRRSLALLLPAVLLAACAQSPTATTDRTPSIRYDGGLYYGSGNAVDPAPGGILMGGGGKLIGSGTGTGDGVSLDPGVSMAEADSATATGRGGNYFGSGN
jgi:hypothetical protein